MKYPQNSTLVTPLKRRCSKSIRQAKPKITSPEVNSTGSRMLCGFPQRFLTCVLVTVILFVAPPGVRGQECSDNAGCYPPYFDILEVRRENACVIWMTLVSPISSFYIRVCLAYHTIKLENIEFEKRMLKLMR